MIDRGHQARIEERSLCWRSLATCPEQEDDIRE